MKLWRRAGIILLLVAVIILGFMLPSIVFRVQDNQNEETQTAVSATSVQLDLSSALTLLQKLRIVAEHTSISPVELDAALNMDADQALDELLAGLDEMFPLDVEELPFTAEGFSEVNHQILLKASGENSLIYWEFWLSDADGNQIIATVDDDTGLILSLRYTLISVDVEESTDEPEIYPDVPLYINRSVPGDTASIFARNGIFGGLEELETSTEEFAEMLQIQYCRKYLRSRGYYFTWDVDTSEQDNDIYRYSVMMVDNEGGYYVLPFIVANNEITINGQ